MVLPTRHNVIITIFIGIYGCGDKTKPFNFKEKCYIILTYNNII